MRPPADPDTPAADQPPALAEEPKPFFSIVSGEPTPEELAALTVVLAAAASGDEAQPPASVSWWATPQRKVRTIGAPGPGSWRAEYQPR